MDGVYMNISVACNHWKISIDWIRVVYSYMIRENFHNIMGVWKFMKKIEKIKLQS